MGDRLRGSLTTAGMSRLIDKGAVLDRQPVEDKWLAPATLWLTGAPEPAIDWDGEGEARRAADDGMLFDRFLRLSVPAKEGEALLGEREPNRVLDFARRYGLLELCAAHNQPLNGCAGRLLEDTECSQLRPPIKVAEWCRYSRQVRSMLTLAAALHRGEEGPSEDWAHVLVELLEWPNSRIAVREFRRSGSPWMTLGSCVNRWLAFGRVGIALDWDNDGPVGVMLTTGSLFGVLARHLFLTIRREKGIAVCTCGEFFEPKKRAPKRGQKTWCPACRDNHYRRAKSYMRR